MKVNKVSEAILGSAIRTVQCEDNYTARAQKLLELLPKRGPKAFSTLMEILAITNPWLAEKMKSALHEERKREAKLKISSTASDAGQSANSLCLSRPPPPPSFSSPSLFPSLPPTPVSQQTRSISPAPSLPLPLSLSALFAQPL